MDQKWPKKPQNGAPKMMTKRCKKWSQCEPKWPRIDRKNCPKSPQNHPLLVLFWSLHDPKNGPKNAPCLVSTVALENAQKRSKVTKKIRSKVIYAYVDFYSQNGGMSDLELQSELWCGSWLFSNVCVWGGGVKIRRIGQLVLFPVRTPQTDRFGPSFWLEKCQACIRGCLKRLRTVKNSLFGYLMHSIACLSPGLRYRIQLWGQWHHYNGLVILKERKR